MGGWIKKEKDLREDIRVQRIAASLLKAGVTHGRYSERAAVTLVLGALDQLWMHADTFARDDDSIELTLDEIDKLTGIEGFGKLLPTDWLEVLDSESVKLPGFHSHNGAEAKRKALTAKRVSKHRNASALQGLETSNGLALPDQTRPDQTKTKPDQEGESFAPPPGLDLGSFSKWSEYRTQIGKPLAPASLFAAQRKLAAFGEEQAAVVEQSIANGWHGLFHLKTERGGGKSGWKKPRSIAELEAEEAARGHS